MNRNWKEVTADQAAKFHSNTSMFLLFGFAIGNYIHTCNKCKEHFTGDKRAITCFECAEKKLDDPTLAERYRLPADLSDGVHWSIVNDMPTVMQCIRERIDCMDDQELADLFKVRKVYMTDAEVESLPDL